MMKKRSFSNIHLAITQRRIIMTELDKAFMFENCLSLFRNAKKNGCCTEGKKVIGDSLLRK